MLENGSITPTDLFWSEGMTGWLPISEGPKGSPPQRKQGSSPITSILVAWGFFLLNLFVQNNVKWIIASGVLSLVTTIVLVLRHVEDTKNTQN